LWRWEIQDGRQQSLCDWSFVKHAFFCAGAKFKMAANKFYVIGPL
jgi:hypothetical protein